MDNRDKDCRWIERGVCEAAARIFPVEIAGRAAAVSQFGIEYWYWGNGAIKPEGDRMNQWPVSEWAPPAMVKAATDYFEGAYAAGARVLVWREYPEATLMFARSAEENAAWHEPAVATPERWGLIFRLHFMGWDFFVDKVKGTGRL